MQLALDWTGTELGIINLRSKSENKEYNTEILGIKGKKKNKEDWENTEDMEKKEFGETEIEVKMSPYIGN